MAEGARDDRRVSVFVCLIARDIFLFKCLSGLEHTLALVFNFAASSDRDEDPCSRTSARDNLISSNTLPPRVDLCCHPTSSMSLRSFTVFQDVVPSDAPQPKISRPNAMIARSSLNVALPTNATSTTGELLTLDKENYHPVTGERAGPSNIGTKRKTTVLAIKVQPEPATKSKNDKESDREPEQKKRKASTSSTSKGKVKKNAKGTGSTKKSTSKRAAARKVSPMPKLNEEEESEKEPITQADIDSRCYELTVKPLADVSQAYEETPLLATPPACTPDTSEEKVKFHATKVRFFVNPVLNLIFIMFHPLAGLVR